MYMLLVIVPPQSPKAHVPCGRFSVVKSTSAVVAPSAKKTVIGVTLTVMGVTQVNVMAVRVVLTQVASSNLKVSA